MPPTPSDPQPASTPPALTWRTFAGVPEAEHAAVGIERDLPPFLAALTAQVRTAATRSWPHTQWLVEEDGLPVAVVRAVALRWSGEPDDVPAAGLGEAVTRAGEPDADTLAVLDVVVAYGARGRGVGAAVLRDLHERRREGGHDRLLVLLRPHHKEAYPLVPFARYASFTRDDGLPFDPWLRAAWRAGFVPVAGVDRSFVGRADLDRWQDWLARPVPGSGPYLVPGAIKPAILETERAEGRYREPHLWAAPVSSLTVPPPARWVNALAAAGVVPGDRSHREVRRPR